MKISVVGTGYVGLVSGACLAELGHEVVCVDVDPGKVDMITTRNPPIYERGLQELLDRNVPDRLTATTDLRKAVLESELSMIAVGTPFDGTVIDLKYVRQVATDIGNVLREKPDYHMVVVKSTVVPGTTTDVVLRILEEASGKTAGKDFGVGMNPEFLREGEAIEDFMHPDRIVLGAIDKRSTDALDRLYSVFRDVDVVRTDPGTAEMIKYTANSLLATLISFSNEIANLCAAQKIDVADVMKGVHLDRRFSPILAGGERVTPGLIAYLWPGAGFGGSCFPKDVRALIAHGASGGANMQLLSSVIDVNNRQPQKMIEMLEKGVGKIDGIDVTVLGVAFKPGTDDIRESPSIPVIQALAAKGARVTAFDPIARKEAEHVLGNTVVFRDTLAEAINGAKAILLMTAWPEFKNLPELVGMSGSEALVIDGRRMLYKTSVTNYAGIGL
jgi:UDPglucose 6-dehydrogenase/GDP-mannose 6-dehydrogenase